MLVAKLIGNVWSTRKFDSLNGMKLMLVEVILGSDKGKKIVAVDSIGAGIGDRVIVTTGSTARVVIEQEFNQLAPVDAVISGIIDEDCYINE